MDGLGLRATLCSDFCLVKSEMNRTSLAIVISLSYGSEGISSFIARVTSLSHGTEETGINHTCVGGVTYVSHANEDN
ncbi:uncharacterized protein LOC143256357 isoform X4 [Tachypleus tridentatus]|uniref:uncharacterized protein LOC143256357 isoform X4 n=1 Tax=Tachypleus tridentatus TaxID=6853 RepID=UPI003FCFD98E